MAEGGEVRTLTQEQAVKQIVQSVARAPAGEAPFALVLGAGFSDGLVPTVKEIITRHLPIWAEANGDAAAYRRRLERIAEAEAMEVAGGFWRKFVADNDGRRLNLPLTAAGLPEPERFADAYQAAFSSHFDSVIGAPADARRFQRVLVQPPGPRRTNPAHFLLGTVLGAQPGRFKLSDEFQFKGAFSRLILTTNFDSFLQSALHPVGHPYLMSDTPDLGVSDEISDDETDTIHLVYLHGSVHRRAQAATQEDIRRIKEKNAQILAPVLKRRGVIVLGYSGWDDVIVEALSCCEDFNHRLYWFGRAADPLAPGVFGPRVPAILAKRSACYVRTAGAAHVMHLLGQALVRSLPESLGRPVACLREYLESFTFNELSELARQEIRPAQRAALSMVDAAARACSAASLQAPSTAHAMEAARLQTIQALQWMSSQLQPANAAPTSAARPRPTEPVERLTERARLALAFGAHSEAISYCSEALRADVADPNTVASLCDLKAQAHLGLCQFDEAIEQWRAVIELPGVPWPQVASARLRRGRAYVQADRPKEALEDFNHVIERAAQREESAEAVETMAAALLNRAAMFAQPGHEEAELADCARVISDLPGVSASTKAAALYRRGAALLRQHRFEEALGEFNRFIRMPEANEECRRKALVERGQALEALKRRQAESQADPRMHDRSPGALIEASVRSARAPEAAKAAER